MKKILLYPGWLRTWHWVNVLFFVVLIWTGVELHFARPGTAGLGFSRSRVLHNTVGILLTFNYLVFVLGNLMSGNGKYYILNFGKVSRGLLKQFRYYVWGIFRGEPHPYQHSIERKFNPLQKITYTIVMYLILPLMIISGWAVFFPDKIPTEILGVSGRLFYALTHTFLGYLLGLFMMVHIYLGTTGSTPLEARFLTGCLRMVFNFSGATLLGSDR
jgi:thiosulfate reductase cytochrome b subunit